MKKFLSRYVLIMILLYIGLYCANRGFRPVFHWYDIICLLVSAIIIFMPVITFWDDFFSKLFGYEQNNKKDENLTEE